MSRGDFDKAWEKIAGGLGAMIVVTDGIVDVAKREYSKNKDFLNVLELEMRADQQTMAAYVREQVNNLGQDPFNRELYLGAAAVAYDLIKRQAIDNQNEKERQQ